MVRRHKVDKDSLPGQAEEAPSGEYEEELLLINASLKAELQVVLWCFVLHSHRLFVVPHMVMLSIQRYEIICVCVSSSLLRSSLELSDKAIYEP